MFRSFAFTIRPRDGITDTTIAAYHKWFKKLDYAFVVLEKEGHERHLHAQVWLTKPRAKGDIIKQADLICLRTIPDWAADGSQKKVQRGGIRVAYSDWHLDYLSQNDLKIDSPNIILDNQPNNTYEYYPTEEEQESVKQLANAVDQRYFALEQKCSKYLEDQDKSLTHKTVASFLNDAMFNSRTIKVIEDPRRRNQVCYTLYCYMLKSSDIYNFIPKDPAQKKYEKILETQPTPNPNIPGSGYLSEIDYEL